jgi:Family of unknown function (DUF5995)
MRLQNKLFFILLFSFVKLQAQYTYNKVALDSLLSIAKDSTISKPFAQMYIQSIEISNIYLHTLTANEKEFIMQFSTKFSGLFFAAHNSFVNHHAIPSNWQFYYQQQHSNDLQYKFMGLNAHVNGDISLALIAAHHYDSILKYKTTIINFQKSFDVFFDSIYKTTFAYKKLRHIHHITLGLDKWIGKRMVYRWRKRQVNLALWYHTNFPKYMRMRKRIDKQMQRLNRFAIKKMK